MKRSKEKRVSKVKSVSKIKQRNSAEYRRNLDGSYNKAIKRVELLEKHKRENPSYYDSSSNSRSVINKRKKLEDAYLILSYYSRMKKDNKKAYIIDLETPSYEHKPYTRELVFMKPQRFIKLTPEVPNFSERSINNLRERIKDGKKLEPPFLEVHIDDMQVVSHEGRHRAFVAKEQGVSEIPVIVVHREDMREIPAIQSIDMDLVKSQA